MIYQISYASWQIAIFPTQTAMKLGPIFAIPRSPFSDPLWDTICISQTVPNRDDHPICEDRSISDQTVHRIAGIVDSPGWYTPKFNADERWRLECSQKHVSPLKLSDQKTIGGHKKHCRCFNAIKLDAHGAMHHCPQPSPHLESQFVGWGTCELSLPLPPGYQGVARKRHEKTVENDTQLTFGNWMT